MVIQTVATNFNVECMILAPFFDREKSSSPQLISSGPVVHRRTPRPRYVPKSSPVTAGMEGFYPQCVGQWCPTIFNRVLSWLFLTPLYGV